MDLLERYLQAVGEYLPAGSKADTLAELRENLLAQMEAREEELGRSLTLAEVAAVLERHGRPMIVAARYLPQQYLIGPGMFPAYWYTLKKSFPLLTLVYVVVQLVAMFTQGWRDYDLVAAVLHFSSVALIFWAILTAGFAFFEYAQGRYIHKVQLSDAWNPNDLPPLAQKEKPKSFVSGLADVIVSALLIAWLLSVPYKPFLILGPALGYVRSMPFGLTPEWRIFYWQIVGLLVVQLVLKLVMLMLRGATRWQQGIYIAMQGVTVLVLTVMVQARTYFVQGTSAGAMTMKDLMSLNYALNLSFKIALAVSVMKLLWDIWRMVRDSHVERGGSLAGSRGC